MRETRKLELDILSNYSVKIAKRKLNIYNVLNNTKYSLKDIGIWEDGKFTYYDEIVILHDFDKSNILSIPKDMFDNFVNRQTIHFSVDKIKMYEEDIISLIDNLNEVINNLVIKVDYKAFQDKYYMFLKNSIICEIDILKGILLYTPYLVKIINGKLNYPYDITNSIYMNNFERIFIREFNSIRNTNYSLHDYKKWSSFNDVEYYFNMPPITN